ncbi:MAG TPA: SpoIIE family protein phosphatase [Anaerolineae bacterium]
MSIGTTTVIRRAFGELEKETLDTLRSVAVRRTYPPETVLCHQGEIEHTFYVVVEGNVAITQELEDGEERFLGLIGPNGYFGEMGLIDDSPRIANCITVAPTTVLEVTEEMFDKFLEQSPLLAYAVLERILATARKLDRLALADLQQKNEELAKAYTDLQAAQARIVEQERLEHEMELAAEVQRSLLPARLPQFPDYRFAAYLQPARQVGGDFYDVIKIDSEHVGLLIADVADKGVHASLFMAVTRTLFLQEGKRSLSPAQVALAVHQGMLDVASSADFFVTAFYGLLHRPSGRLTYVRAAHERPLLYRPGQPVEALAGGGRFLGMLPELQLEEYTVQLRAGDRLVLFSDGVTDAINPGDEQYGGQRLAAALVAGGQLSAAALVRHIAADVARWSQGAPAFDDLTLLVAEAKTNH